LIADTIAKKNSSLFFRSKGRTLLFLSILFIVSRLLILLLNFEPFIMEEERYNGTIALEVLNGLKMPLFYYQHQPYAPGAMVVGLLSTPFFLILGSSYISLKVIALMFSLCTLIFWYLFLYRFFNPRVAVLTAFLFILSPPNNIKFSLLALGNHYEINFFTILSLFLFYKIFFSDDPLQKESSKSKGIEFFLLGLVSGFACYFALTFFAALLTIAIFWFAFDKRFFLKNSFFIFITASLIGFSPWIYNTISFKLGSINFHGKPIYLFENSEPYVIKFFRMVVTGMPFSFGFEGIKGTTLDAYLYFLILLVSFIFLVKVNSSFLKKIFFSLLLLKKFRVTPQEISRETVLLVFPILYCLIFTLSDFKVPIKVLREAFALRTFDNFFYLAYRYFTPLFPFFFAFIALFLDRLWYSKKERGFKKGFALFLLAIVLSLCGLSYMKLARPVDFGKGFLYSGSDYFIMGEKFADRYREEPLEGISIIKRIDNQYKTVALRGFGRYFGKNTDLLPLFLEKIRDLDERFKISLYQGAARGMFESLKLDKARLNFFRSEDGQSMDILKLIGNLDEKYKNLFYLELGNLLRRDIKLKTDKNMAESLRLLNYFSKGYKPRFENMEIEYNGGNEDVSFWTGKINQLPEIYRDYFYKALGNGMGWFLFYQKEEFLKAADIIPEKYRGDFYEGVGISSSSLFTQNIEQAIKLTGSLDKKYSFPLYRAIGEAIFWKYGYNLNKAITLINSINKKEEKEYCYEGLGSGIGYMLWWNPEKINKMLEEMEEPYRSFCESGIKKRIEEDFFLTKQNYFGYFRLKINY